jgi:hypothetical protein
MFIFAAFYHPGSWIQGSERHRILDPQHLVEKEFRHLTQQIVIKLSEMYVYPGSQTVLRIRDVYPGSWILIFTHSGSRISDPGSQIPDPKTGTKERGQ